MFKSYYVVWKPVKYLEIRLNDKEFKSYYVVWKLWSSKMCLLRENMFKSYYVVWKQIDGTNPLILLGGLNRTM